MVPEMARLGRLRALLIDLDGVVYRGDTALPGAGAFFGFLRERGLRFCLITNNSTKTPDEFAAKLNRMGIAAEPSDVLTSSEATAAYLRQTARAGSRVLVIGGRGLREAVRQAGFRISVRQPDHVVVGLDVRFSYAKLRRGAAAIRSGASFIASNADASLPTEDGEIPGAGAIVAALQVASGVSPTVIGKPQPLMLELAMRRLGVTATETALVGDRLDTDVLAGRRFGICTILVLTGVTTREQVAAAEPRPDFVFSDLGALRRAMEATESDRSYGAAE